MRLLLFVIISFISTASFAEVMSEDQREKVIAQAQQKFWGNAVLANGEKVQPASETERKTLPIPKSLAHAIVDSGAISGLGQWCGLEWKPHYFSITKAARKHGMNEKQLAFIGFLHGIAQGGMSSTMAGGEKCDDEIKVNVQQLLDQSKANWTQDN